MSIESNTSIRQYSFDLGPNYTDDPFMLGEREVAESDNMYYDGELRTIPGAARLVTTAITGSPAKVVGMYHYVKKDGAGKFVAVTDGGRMVYQNGTVWTNIVTTLSTNAATIWDWITFNDTMVAVSGSNVVKKWDGTTFGNLGGTPPQSKYVSVHGDYVLLAGHTSSPSQVRYSDTNDVNVWPAGNTLNFGLNDGQIITGLQRFGDVTIIFKERSVWLLAGTSPTDFTIAPTLSDVGCISPGSIVLTDSGVFFWSEAGPAIFNGIRSTLLNERLQRTLETIDLTTSTKFHAGYYPFKKQLLVSYQRNSQTNPDRILILDMFRSLKTGSPAIFWPVLFGATSMTEAEDSTGRRRVYFGHDNGFVTAWDSGSTFNNSAITPRIRTRIYDMGGDRARNLGVRTSDYWVDTTATGSLVVRYGVDGATTLTTHALSGVAMTNSGKGYKLVRLDGDGAGSLIVGRLLQDELTISGGGTLTLHGIEHGLEDLGRRND